MQRRRFPRPVLLGLLLLPVIAGGFILQGQQSRVEGIRLFSNVVELVSQRFVDTVTTGDLYEKAARGLLEELNDPYTELLTPKDRVQFQTRTGGRYGGVGMQIEKRGPWVTVSKVFPNTPAERAGIREGDRIIAVDTAPARDWSLDQVSSALLGTPGTKVSARFERPGVDQPIAVNFTRAEIKVPAVPYAITFDDVGYIPLQTFNEFASEEVEAALQKFQQQGTRGVVLDLRGNPGGIFDQAVYVSDLFLGDGQEITAVRGRATQEQVYRARGRPVAPSIPVVVLTDGFSASASEIVAGALQDHDRALIVGTTSFGKGLVQTVYELPDGYAVKMTTAKYYLPSGRLIQKERRVVNGVFVRDDLDAAPDSMETDSVKKDRPEFKSDGGRVVYGGGGITPDIIVQPDTISTPEQEFLKVVAPRSAEFYVALQDYTLQLSKSVRPNFTIQPPWRDEFYRRITGAGVKVERQLYDRAAPTVDRMLENGIARFAFGDSTAKRMGLEDDAQLRRALDILRSVRTQADLFAVARVSNGTKPD
jgi:carboxyl-terminal processing protease